MNSQVIGISKTREKTSCAQFQICQLSYGYIFNNVIYDIIIILCFAKALHLVAIKSTMSTIAYFNISNTILYRIGILSFQQTDLIYFPLNYRGIPDLLCLVNV